MFRNSSGVAGGGGEEGARGTRGRPAPALHSRGGVPGPQAKAKSGGRGRPGSRPVLLCLPLSFLHTLKEIFKPVSFIEFIQERKAAFLGTLIFRVISYLTYVNT